MMNHRSEIKIALLRGINIGRAKRISMSDLRSIAEGLGFINITTVLNSGNLIFNARMINALDTERSMERAIEEKFGISVNVIVLSSSDLNKIILENPLKKIATDFSRYIVYILKNRDELANLKSLNEQNWGSEVLAAGSLAAYLWCPEGVIASKLVKAVERVFGKNITGRNWNTLLKIQSLVREYGDNHHG